MVIQLLLILVLPKILMILLFGLLLLLLVLLMVLPHCSIGLTNGTVVLIDLCNFKRVIKFALVEA